MTQEPSGSLRATVEAPRDFRTTHWSLVLNAGVSSPDGQSALETLCRTYWYPLYAFVRRSGHGPDESADLTQEFFVRFLESDSLGGVHPDRGRFRSFLLAALKNFLAKEWRDANRLKRGGGKEIIAWDQFEPEERYHLEPTGDVSPEVLFDRRWAHTLVARVLERLEAEQVRDGFGERFRTLEPYLQGGAEGPSYVEVGRRLGLSEAAVKVAVFRLRRRYGELIREEIAATVATPEEVQAELNHLIEILAG